MQANKFFSRSLWVMSVSVLSLMAGTAHAQSLFSNQGQAQANSNAHIQSSQSVRINRGALQQPTLTFDLNGQSVTAVRTHIDRGTQGQTVWKGHLQNDPANTVIIAGRGNFFSGVIRTDTDTFELRSTSQDGQMLNRMALDQMPHSMANDAVSGGGSTNSGTPATLANPIEQDILVAYTQQACDDAAAIGDVNCIQVQLNTVVAISDLNSVYTNSGINIQMNFLGVVKTDYDETGKSLSQTLDELRLTNDGNMDELHTIRDQMGADLVALIYDGPGCGIAYAPSSPTSAFSVTKQFCMLGNRTLAHEIGHNQGALHDRAQHGGGISGNYNYGYRRCNDGSLDDLGAPYFRTVMSYSCTGANRVGHFSNPNVNYSGVPTGVDPLVDATRAAWNARTLNESAAYVAGFRNTVAQTIPNAPSALTATVDGPDQVTLDWTDNSNNEYIFTIERSLDGAAWNGLAQSSINTVSYVDINLQADTDYFYRVRTENNAGASTWSNVEMVTTDPAPVKVEDVARSEVSSLGSAAGTYSNTHDDDGIFQKIDETRAGGPRNRPKQGLEHRWEFDVIGGAGGVTFSANAYVSGSEGMHFDYSVDNGSSWTRMFTVNSTSLSNTQTYIMPGATAGVVWVRATDATRANNEATDSLYVDELVFASEVTPGNPPVAPTALSVIGVSPNTVSMSFTDQANDEFGFEIYRNPNLPTSCTDGVIIDSIPASAGTGTVNYVDTTVTGPNAYWYFVTAFNGAGTDGNCSNNVLALTPAGTAITASGNGYKVKGKHVVDVTWTGGSGTSMDIVRDGNVIAQPANTGSYTDNIGAKGGATYVYEVCETGSSTACSPSFTITF